MVLGIIGIIVGVIWFLSSLFSSVESAPQQTVQYLGFVCGSIFIIGGVILLKMDSFIVKLRIDIRNIYDKLNNLDENIEIVYKEKIFDDSNDSKKDAGE